MKKRWIAFSLVVVASFAILGWIGTRIYQEMPPIPDQVVSRVGKIIVSNGQIGRGQNVWQTMGGMEVGSIWGHGSYVAPDWTADWLHRETTFILDEWAQAEFGREIEQLSAENRAKLRGRLEEMYRTNNFEASTNTLRIEDIRGRAFEACLAHYSEVFMEGNTAYAIPASTINDSGRMRDLAAFFFWTSWAASTVRPGDDITYTHNWPHEPLIGNRPTGETVMWTGVSIIMLLAGICTMVWWYTSQRREEAPAKLPEVDPLGNWQATSSQIATLKYFWVVAALILVQMLMGVLTAHYGVEGDGFYGN